MVHAIPLLEIDGVIIDSNAYYDIQVYSSINSHLPILTFKLKDTTGDYWKNLDYTVGSSVIVHYVDDSSEDPDAFSTTEFIIEKLYNGFELNDSQQMSGFVQVTCSQAWKFYSDYTPHAYDCQHIGSLIKSICENAKSEAKVIVDDDNFAESTDSGSIRYKTCISDLDFITDKLLRFTIIDNSNALFFLDKSGTAHLSGFNTLYSQKEKLIICPNIEQVEGAQKSLYDVMDNKNIKSYAQYASIEANIASNSGVIDQLKNRIYIYDTQLERVMVGSQTPSINLGKDSSKVKKTYIPVKDSIISDVVATNASYLGNRSFEEQMAASRNELLPTNNLMNLTVMVGSFLPEVNIGDTVFLWIPPTPAQTGELNKDGLTEMTDKAKTHWMVGKWLVATEAIVTLESNNVAIRYDLVKPALEFSEDSTTLSDYKSLYKVK